MSIRRSELSRTSPVRDLRVQRDDGRQTPRRLSFATVLARGVQTALAAGANLLAPVAPAGVALAASVGSAAAAASGAPGSGGTSGPLGTGGGAGTVGAGSEMDLLRKQAEMRSQDRLFNLQYLDLQRKVQQDQRQFQVMSNLLKTKHDTVKTAINNLR